MVLLLWCNAAVLVPRCCRANTVIMPCPLPRLFLLHLFNTEPVLPLQTTTDAPLLLRSRNSPAAARWSLRVRRESFRALQATSPPTRCQPVRALQATSPPTRCQPVLALQATSQPSRCHAVRSTSPSVRGLHATSLPARPRSAGDEFANPLRVAHTNA